MAELRVGGAAVVRANAVRLPLRDESVDLVVTSPPYFALRSYRDGGAHYDGQVGSEPTPQAFLEALWLVMHDVWRVLKPTGSVFVNLGDKRSGSGGHNNAGITKPRQDKFRTRDAARAAGVLVDVAATLRNAPDRYTQAAFGRPKSKMLLPHRFAIGCEDGLADPDGMGWVVRQDIVWSKLNGLPESVTDRTRDSHEYVFHLTKQGRYFSAVDEVREPQDSLGRGRPWAGDIEGSVPTWGNENGTQGLKGRRTTDQMNALNPLGKLPGSVWPLASEPLVLSDAVKAHYDLPDHFAAFPTELPRRLILGWSPSGVCVACGEGRRPVVAKDASDWEARKAAGEPMRHGLLGAAGSGAGNFKARSGHVTGYACACRPSCPTHDFDSGFCVGPCPDRTALPTTRPAVVLDPFSGTGTVPGVARALGRFGVGVDLSHDYCRLAAYFMGDGRGRFAKTASRTDRERQGSLL